MQPFCGFSSWTEWRSFSLTFFYTSWKQLRFLCTPFILYPAVIAVPTTDVFLINHRNFEKSKCQIKQAYNPWKPAIGWGNSHLFSCNMLSIYLFTFTPCHIYLLRAFYAISPGTWQKQVTTTSADPINIYCIHILHMHL